MLVRKGEACTSRLSGVSERLDAGEGGGEWITREEWARDEFVEKRTAGRCGDRDEVGEC